MLLRGYQSVSLTRVASVHEQVPVRTRARPSSRTGAISPMRGPYPRHRYRDGVRSSLRFSGAVLAGGRSIRMGRDKALLPVGGRALVTIAADALRDAGASEVLVIGGDAVALQDLGLTLVVDRWPGEGPLAGLATALAAAHDEVVAVLACDLPFV